MEYQSMTKAEILEAATKEKIPLSIHTLNNYIKIGLLKGEKNSIGRHGTLPSRYHCAMENIRLIHQFSSLPYNYKHQDIIYILYWFAMPVRTHIMMKDLQIYHQQQLTRLDKFKNDYQSAEDSRMYIADLIKDETKRLYSSPSGGRPNRAKQDQMNSQNEMKLNILFKGVTLIMEFINAGVLNLSMLSKIMNDTDLGNKDEGFALEQVLSKHSIFSLDTWTESAAFTDREHEILSENLIVLVRKYWEVLLTSSTENSSGKGRNNIFDLSAIPINVSFLKLLIYLVLASGQVSTIVSFLAKPSNIKAWEAMCMEYFTERR